MNHLTLDNIARTRSELEYMNTEGYTKPEAKGFVRTLDENGEITRAEADTLLEFIDSLEWEEYDF